MKAVNTLNVKPKKKSRWRAAVVAASMARSAGWKKAIVTLDPGQRIDIFEQV